MRTGGVEPPQREAAGLQPVELADAQRPHGVTGRVRTGATTLEGSRATTTPRARAPNRIAVLEADQIRPIGQPAPQLEEPPPGRRTLNQDDAPVRSEPDSEPA